MRILARVIPNSKNEGVEDEGAENGVRRMKIRVTVPAKEGKANTRAIALLAEHFDVPKSSVTIVKGLHSKNKIIRIDV